MKEVYPEFADSVDFYAVGQDPTESLEKMERYRQEQGYPWPVAKTDTSTLRKLRVLQASTKLAVDDRGIIAYRAVHGGGDPETWRAVFRQLARGVESREGGQALLEELEPTYSAGTTFDKKIVQR